MGSLDAALEYTKLDSIGRLRSYADTSKGSVPIAVLEDVMMDTHMQTTGDTTIFLTDAMTKLRIHDIDDGAHSQGAVCAYLVAAAVSLLIRSCVLIISSGHGVWPTVNIRCHIADAVIFVKRKCCCL